MRETPVPVVDAPAAVVTRPPRAWPALALALAAAAGYAVFFVLPYYVNHLDRFPLEEVASGYHDPKDLWPRNTALGGLATLGGLLTMVLGPLVVLGVLAWVPYQLVTRRRDLGLRGVVVLVLAATVAVSTMVWATSPFAEALMGWWLD